jgi:hypothetical protein
MAASDGCAPEDPVHQAIVHARAIFSRPEWIADRFFACLELAHRLGSDDLFSKIDA